MQGEDLPRKPLTEALFELRWKLVGDGPRPPVDPHYKLLVGSLYDKVRTSYPHHEQLPAATVPDEFIPYVIQHRFRASDGGYPLIQVGPGVFAANDTDGYSWSAFRPRVLEAVQILRNTYAGQLEPQSLLLRYINAVPFDAMQGDVLTYLRENLKVSLDYPQKLFSQQPVEQRPDSLAMQSTHQLTDPAGTITLKFATGEVSSAPQLLWEIQVQSAGDDVPDLEHDLEKWLDRAHAVARAWFFTLIEGKLEMEFRN